jgi:UDPglucose 6-dehydrogenase
MGTKFHWHNTISVIGSGYVGVTTAAIAANTGYKVYLIDINQERIDVLKTGKSFFYEEGIDALIKNALDSKQLIPTTSYDGITKSSIVFSCVGTPDNSDGSPNLDYVFSAAKAASNKMKKDAVYVQKSTVPVGTGKIVASMLPGQVAYISNPEFLREGTAVFDTLNSDRIVIGGADKEAQNKVKSLYETIEHGSANITKLTGITAQPHANGSYFLTNLESAELIKVTANAFLALKISFANSIAKLADKTGADITEVMDAVGADARINRSFLNAGRGYGGGCFPKDVSGLISSAAEHGVDLSIMTAANEVNESMPGYIVHKAKRSLTSFEKKKIAVLGLAFKAGTSDTRRSPGIKIANLLANAGAYVVAYDPHANKEAVHELKTTISIVETIVDATKNVDAVFIATEWPEFKQQDFHELSRIMKGNLVVDAVNILNPSDILKAGLQYIGIGRG